MEEKRKTYKEKIDADKMLDEMHKLISTIEKIKDQLIGREPGLREYIVTIPNAGIFAYNKMNEFIKKLAEKSIDDESVIYAVLKRELSSRVVVDNINDLLGYDVANLIEEKRALENSEDKGLIEVKKPTIWQRIKRFINQKIFNIYMTDEDMENLNKALEICDNARKKVRDEVTERVEKIYKIELDKELVSQAISNYASIISQKDGNIEVFKQEVAEELEKLGMQDLVKRIDEMEMEEKSFRESIKYEVDNSVQSEPSVAKGELEGKEDLAYGGAR